jgi:hypothetical protein
VSVLSALVFAIGAATSLGAQASFELGPTFGYYRPVGSFAPTTETAIVLPTRPSDLGGSTWGGEARAWFGHRLGVQVAASVTNSTITYERIIPVALPQAQAPGGSTDSIRAQVLVVTAQAQYDLSPTPGDHWIWVSAGPAMVRHGGAAYAMVGTAVDVGAALGAGLELPIGSHLRALLSAKSLLYELHVRESETGTLVEGGVQTDLLFHLGLAWRWR